MDARGLWFLFGFWLVVLTVAAFLLTLAALIVLILAL